MTRVYQTFPAGNINNLKQQMLSWGDKFNICCFLDNHQYESNHHSYECLLAVGAQKIFEPKDDFFAALNQFDGATNDWIFGHFSYDLKNVIEAELSSNHTDEIGFPDVFLFVPKVVLQLKNDCLIIGAMERDTSLIFEEIKSMPITSTALTKIEVEPRLAKEEYTQKVKQLIEHIRRGNCYEINFCQEFFGHGAINPQALYIALSEVSPNPFCAYYKLNDKYLLCSSPERYISKQGNTLISQPIKGTVARSGDNATDEDNRQLLMHSEKERSENVMIVDLVRNDLSKVCVEGTVTVDELFGVYSFPYVHQMISTISGTLRDKLGIADVLKATFPMGSMTGAPKRKVMELIENFEVSKRGIYSGAVGYISPEKNFDFNVVIRSIIYNQQSNYISYHVGSAITFKSDPEEEYEECLVKAGAIKQILSQTF